MTFDDLWWWYKIVISVRSVLCVRVTNPTFHAGTVPTSQASEAWHPPVRSYLCSLVL